MASKSFSLDGKRALTTSGTNGIGLATAKRFVSHGARIVISGRRSEGLHIGSDIGGEFVAADMTMPDQIVALVDAAAKKLGGLDILICHAGEVRDMIMIEDTDWLNPLPAVFWRRTYR